MEATVSVTNQENSNQQTSLGKKIFAIILGIGAITGAILSAHQLYKVINPPPAPPPAQAKGEISDVAVENTEGGLKVIWKATVEGYKGKTLTVRWTLYNASAMAPVDDALFRDQVGATLKPTFNSDQGSGHFFVPPLKEQGTYYLRIELDPPNAATLDSEKSENFDWIYDDNSPSDQDLDNQGTDLQNEETTPTSDQSGSAPPDEDIQNLNTPPSQASEGVVVVSPDFNVEAATAEEAEAINAAIAYYQYAETGDYNTTYDLLSSDARSYYTREEWVTVNTNLDSAAGEFVVVDAYPYDLGLGIPTYAVTVTVYLADGSSFNRTTYFIYEAGYWAHHLTSEEVSMFDEALY
jgi:hypothetical protein